MEARLGGAPDGGEETKPGRSQSPPDEAGEAVAVVDDRQIEGSSTENGGQNPPLQASESINAWNDEAAESAFRAEASERGEPVSVSMANAEGDNETDSKDLPPLDELVKRLSPEVRETLDDLFRAKFTGVRKMPKKALKA